MRITILRRNFLFLAEGIEAQDVPNKYNYPTGWVLLIHFMTLTVEYILHFPNNRYIGCPSLFNQTTNYETVTQL